MWAPLPLSVSASSSSAVTHGSCLHPASRSEAWAAACSSSPGVFTNTDHRNPPDEPKTALERARQRERVFSLWLQQLITITFGPGGFQNKQVCLFFCHCCCLGSGLVYDWVTWEEMAWGHSVMRDTGPRRGCGGKSLSLILESCARGDAGSSISSAGWKHCAVLTPFGTGHTLPEQEACFTCAHTHTHTHTQMHSGHTAGPAEVCVHVQEHSGG